jgi:hypothetical protein
MTFITAGRNKSDIYSHFVIIINNYENQKQNAVNN